MNTTNRTQRVFLVLGMHRSGTSAITRGLETLGINLGDNLRTPRTENPKGFWEDLDFNSINADILDMFKLDWQVPGLITPERLQSDALREQRVRAEKFLESRLSDAPVLGLKDPRASRILPFWEVVFRNIGVEPSYIIASRNPLCVAESLKTRDGFSTPKGIILWLEYMIESLYYSNTEKRIVVEYDKMLESSSTELERIAHKLNLSFNCNTKEFKNYSQKFLSKSLRSTKFCAHDFFRRTDVPEISKNLYKILIEMSENKNNLKSKYFKEKICLIHKSYFNDHAFFSEYVNTSEELLHKINNEKILQKKILFLEKEIKKRNDNSSTDRIKYIFKSKFLSHNVEYKIQKIKNLTLRFFNSLLLFAKSINSKNDLKILFKELKIKITNSNK